MRDMAMRRALCIHDLVFFQDGRQTPRNCKALGIATAFVPLARSEKESHFCGEGRKCSS
jgi:hypothetical protein